VWGELTLCCVPCSNPRSRPRPTKLSRISNERTLWLRRHGTICPAGCKATTSCCSGGMRRPRAGWASRGNWSIVSAHTRPNDGLLPVFLLFPRYQGDSVPRAKECWQRTSYITKIGTFTAVKLYPQHGEWHTLWFSSLHREPLRTPFFP